MVIGSFTTLSRFLGMIRDLLTAGLFGTSLAMSAFVIAFRIPNLFRRLFGEGALSSAFIPVFMETRTKEGDREAWKLAAKVISLVGLVLAAVTVIGILTASFLMQDVEPGTQRALIYPLTRIMLPYMLFICLAALSMAILNSFHHFTIPALTPTLLNVVWIATVIFICPLLGDTMEERIYGLAWGVLFAGVIQLGMQFPVLRRYGFRFRFSLDWRDRRVWKVFLLMGPATLGLAITQINVLVNSILAAWIGPWAPAALFYSERLLYFPQGILATALSTVLLPVFAGHAANKDPESMKTAMGHSLRNLLFVMTPAAVGLVLLAKPIVQMLFEWGQFDKASTDLTAIALQCYAPGLLVFSFAKIFVPAFYAMQDTKTPVKVGLLCVGINLGLNILFILTLPLEIKHAGLAFSTVAAEFVNGAILAVMIHRRIGTPGWGRIGASMLRALFAAGAMTLAILFIYPRMTSVAAGVFDAAKFAQIASVLVSVLVGIAVFLLAARLFRCPEMNDLMDALRRRVNRGDAGGASV